MGNKFGNIKERILQVADKYDVGRKNICEKIGLTYGNFTGKAKNTPLNSDAIGNLLSMFPKINPRWLILGDGDMVIREDYKLIDSPLPQVLEPEVQYRDWEILATERKERIDELKGYIKTLEDKINLLEEKIKPESKRRAG